MTDKVRRAIELTGIDETLELSKVTAIHNVGFQSIHLDKLDDGTWRLIYNSDLIPDLTKLEAFTIIREG